MNKQHSLRTQNSQLRQVIENYLSQIDMLKQTNKQHEDEIESLLKFNQRLLIIIETQLNQYNSKKSQRSYSLQPISQITEKDSQAMEALGSIKASIANLKMVEGGYGDKEFSEVNRRMGNQTERVMLGDHLDDVLSYEISRSDYQKEYSEYSRGDKVKQAIALINAYKQQYGNSIKQCQQINIKIKQDVIHDNHQAQTISNEHNTFYGNKIAQLNNLQQKIKDNNPEKSLQNIIKDNKYSEATRKRLMKIMNAKK